MAVTKIPAKVKVVETVIEPEKYVVELTRHQLLVLGCLSGITCDFNNDGGVFEAAYGDPLYAQYKAARREKIDDPSGLVFKDLTQEDNAYA